MSDHDGLMRIFWPLDLSCDAPGVIVGWRNSGLDVFVVAILEDVDVSKTFLPDSADEVLGAQCGVCPEDGNSASKCASSDIASV
jgi:hypothetical protein